VYFQTVISSDELQVLVVLCDYQASMLSTPDGPFINLARLDMTKYAAKPTLAKALFEYIFNHENDVRNVRLASIWYLILSSTM